MSKQVTRKYINKKGELITKTYTYDSHRYTNGQPKLLTSKGAISKPFIKRVIKEAGLNINPYTEMDVKATVKRLMKTYTQKDLPVGLLSVKRVVASYTGDKIIGMLVNTGFTLEEIAKKANTTVEYLTDAAHWNFSGSADTFMNEYGEVYRFEFSYNEGTLFERIG